MESRGKGTVTSLSSLFPAEEAQKAAQRVKDNITEKYKELDNLHSFVIDNTNLINLVNRLPDELHHQIMVPFGKAAFFPGRLVHTNEFTVLLGEGYFAERSAKQAADILKRRGNMLDSEVDSLKSVITDLKTRLHFLTRQPRKLQRVLWKSERNILMMMMMMTMMVVKKVLKKVCQIQARHFLFTYMTCLEDDDDYIWG